MSRCTTSRRERGSVLLTATVVTLLATMLVMSLAHEAGLRLEARQMLRYGAAALAVAQAGLEAGARKATASTTWRSDPTTWLSQRAVGDGAVDVTASDPADGHVEVSGALGSSSADGVRLTASASVRGLTRVLRADYLPLPHAALGSAVYSQTYVRIQGVGVEGRVRANGDVLDYGAASVRGDITTLTGSTVSPTLDDADTDVFYTASGLAIPAVGFAWFQAAGERISLPVSRVISNTRITTSYNPYGSASARGIYWIDAGGGDVLLSQVAIQACLAVLNARTVNVCTSLGAPTAFSHHSPDPDRLPAMVVQGDLKMRVEGGVSIVLMVGSAPVSYASGLQGVFFCTGNFQGPQLDCATPITVDGAFLGNTVSLVGPGTLVRHDPNLNLYPVVEMTRPGLRLVPDTTLEL